MMSVGYVVLFNVFNTRQLINNKLQTPNIIKTLPNKSMSRPWVFVRSPSLDIHCTVRQQAPVYDDDDEDDVVVFISAPSPAGQPSTSHTDCVRAVTSSLTINWSCRMQILW